MHHILHLQDAPGLASADGAMTVYLPLIEGS